MLSDPFLINNLWVLLAALLVFTMTVSVGFLEVGELGERLSRALMKALIITGSAVVVMAIVGFNTGFAPTVGNGVIGNPTYQGLFLGGFGGNPTIYQSPWWSMAPPFSTNGLTLGTYFLFETAFAAVTLALVGVVVLHKIKMRAFALFSIPYFVLIWNLPAAWIWNPTGWLFKMGMVDFAGGLVVHAAAGAAGLALLVQIWREEKKRGRSSSEVVAPKVNPPWLTLAVLLLWVGWFGFNPGSVLALNWETMVVVLTTFLAAAASLFSVMLTSWAVTKSRPGYMEAANGVLMGLIVITPLAGFVSPGSAFVLGLLCGPVFVYAERLFARAKWFSDPVGLLPGHLVGGLFGISMIAFFTESTYAVAAGAPTSLPNGLFFGGGTAALHQLGIEAFGVVVVMAVVFALSYLAIAALAAALGGVTKGIPVSETGPYAETVTATAVD
ncbi:MAG: ammonium transporter [Thermoplasmata archaeon]|nr:ammonium transporter [Thermoplasmata archaeon]